MERDRERLVKVCCAQNCRTQRESVPVPAKNSIGAVIIEVSGIGC